jgi:hypothetical protein
MSKVRIDVASHDPKSFWRNCRATAARSPCLGSTAPSKSCVEDRDATIYKLSAAIVNLCRMVEYLAEEQQRGRANHGIT